MLKWIDAPDGAYGMDPPVGSELFDLTIDPAEQTPIADRAARERARAALQQALARLPITETDGDSVKLSREELEELQGLGYVK
jgi:hypothetical protein